VPFDVYREYRYLPGDINAVLQVFFDYADALMENFIIDIADPTHCVAKTICEKIRNKMPTTPVLVHIGSRQWTWGKDVPGSIHVAVDQLEEFACQVVQLVTCSSNWNQNSENVSERNRFLPEKVKQAFGKWVAVQIKQGKLGADRLQGLLPPPPPPSMQAVFHAGNFRMGLNLWQSTHAKCQRLPTCVRDFCPWPAERYIVSSKHVDGVCVHCIQSPKSDYIHTHTPR
jgi:hypothetical protein